MVEELQDTIMISMIAGGDLIAIDAECHLNCLASYNRYRSFISQRHRLSLKMKTSHCWHELLLNSLAMLKATHKVGNSFSNSFFCIICMKAICKFLE